MRLLALLLAVLPSHSLPGAASLVAELPPVPPARVSRRVRAIRRLAVEGYRR
ncbi:MAG: hypothetical protein ACXVRJ_13155 [Gaiellaceae bacterium]